LHIVVADLAGGKQVSALYVGTDPAKANEVFEKAGGHEAARLFSHPQPTRLRYPAQEAVEIRTRAAHAERKNNTALAEARLEAEKTKRAAAEAKAAADRAAANLKVLEPAAPVEPVKVVPAPAPQPSTVALPAAKAVGNTVHPAPAIPAKRKRGKQSK
jgi:membrane protein involved in colicin uptake